MHALNHFIHIQDCPSKNQLVHTTGLSTSTVHKNFSHYTVTMYVSTIPCKFQLCRSFQTNFISRSSRKVNLADFCLDSHKYIQQTDYVTTQWIHDEYTISEIRVTAVGTHPRSRCATTVWPWLAKLWLPIVLRCWALSSCVAAWRWC